MKQLDVKVRSSIALALAAASSCIFVVKGNGDFEADWTALTGESGSRTVVVSPSHVVFDTARMRAHIDRLASDEFEGRGPGTMGEVLTTRYLEDQFKALGLAPGNPDGTFVQNVPLTGFQSRCEHHFDVGGKSVSFAFPDETVLLSRRFVPEITVSSSDVVFVGYGIVAPEYGWDDYKDVDVRGKTIVMLVGDPPIAGRDDPSELDPALFGGRAMAYYGRWTYKYEIAAEKGAAAALIVHETGPAGYPFAVVSKSWGRENFDIDPGDKNAHRAAVEGWLRGDRARELFKSAGADLDALMKGALSKAFRPVALAARASFRVQNTLREIASKNVVARLAGSDPGLRAECIVYSAHWDHLGRDPSIPGDGIFNGAVDNASGCAGLIEIARAFVEAEARPARSVVFLAVTAEEKGLLGSKWYATHPLHPLDKTLCNINMDSLNVFGPTADIISVGHGQTTMDEVLVRLAGEAGRVVKSDPQPEKGAYFRSDHFEFARVGVPALYADGGVDLIGAAPGEGLARSNAFTARDYHQPSDEPKSDWNLAGAVADLELLYRLGLEIACGSEWPAWKPGSEFRERRARQLLEAGHAPH